MNLIITKQEENALLKRQDVEADLSFEQKTPSRKEVKKALASHIKVTENLIVIRDIRTQYGFQTAKVSAHVYHTAEAVQEFEPDHFVKRNNHAKKEGEKPAEPVKESKENVEGA
ncbi:MAG: hypothetical protein ABIH34_05420 [Nanoarchaeota archaeon]